MLVNSSDTYSLTLKIQSPHSQFIYVAVYEKEESFLNLDEAILKKKFLSNESGIYTIDSLSKGTYALSFFQDINSNGEFDTTFIGTPEEPYGFSNNALASFGPPSFSDSKFDLEENMMLEVDLQ
jgi:uncharacterized protein (DUF2141 family)